MADRVGAADGTQVLNDVVLNQVLVRVRDRAGTNITPAVMTAVQDEGVCWLGGTQWAGESARRVSVSGWATSEEDIDRSADSILRAVRRIREA